MTAAIPARSRCEPGRFAVRYLGSTSFPLPPEWDWRSFRVAQIRNLRYGVGPFSLAFGAANGLPFAAAADASCGAHTTPAAA